MKLLNCSSVVAMLLLAAPASAVAADVGVRQGLSALAARQLGRPVVKAFNNIYAQHLLERGRPAGSRGRIALPVAGDDAHAKKIVIRLVDQLGFDAVDAGGLDESWRQQPGTPVYAADFDAEGVRHALAEASKERKPKWQATENSPGTFAHPA